MDIPRPEAFFNVRGTMPLNAPSYVKRKADDQLYEALTHGEYCFVLTSRQVGKSSLMTRTAVRMRENKGGAAVVVLDVTSQGENLTPAQWYGGLLDQIGEQLRLEDELMDYWDGHAELGVLPRWMGAITKVALPKLGTRPLVIFVDEVDFTRSLPFKTDEFFAGIRECYNRRTVEPELNRLTFCLVGSARPSDLIRDVRTTPFNIGQRIDLTDFTLEEAMPLAKAMDGNPLQARALLDRVLYWTGGHPYLTQQLCRAVADPSITTIQQVDAACERIFFSPRGRDNDDNLTFVRDRILKSEEDLAQLLALYRKVLSGKPVKSEDNNPLISVMRLSGIMRLVDEKVVIRNRIYRRVFDRKWVDANMPDQEKRRQRAAYRRALIRFGAPAMIIVIIVSSLAGIARSEAKKANEQRDRVSAVLDSAYSSNGQFLRTTEFTGMSNATRELVVSAALEQLAYLQKHVNTEEDREIRLKVAGAYDAIGRVQLKLLELEIGKPAEARASFARASEIREALASKGENDDQRMLRALTLHHLGKVNLFADPFDTTAAARNAREQTARQTLRDVLKIRADELARHPRDPEYAVPVARSLIALGDCCQKYGADAAAKGDFASPREYFEQAARTLDGLRSTPLSDDDARKVEDPPSQQVDTVRATAFERLGLWLALNPATFTDALAMLKKAADESAARADTSRTTSDLFKKHKRAGVAMLLDTARKKLTLATFENKAGDRKQARVDLEAAADYLGARLGAPTDDKKPSGDALKELVPVNIDIRTCLAELFELLASIDAADGATQLCDRVGGCVAAVQSCKLATQERIVVHELNPESRSARDALARSQLQRGHALSRNKGFRESMAVFEQVLDLYKANPTPNPQTAEALLEIGIAQRGIGHFQDARQTLTRAMEQFRVLERFLGQDNWTRRGQARSQAALAATWAAEGEDTKAVDVFSKAIDIQSQLVNEPRSGDVSAEVLEQRLELAASIIHRAEALGNLGRKPDAQSASADVSLKLDGLKAQITAGNSCFNDARLLETLIDAYLDLARSWKGMHNWEEAWRALDQVEKLAAPGTPRDLKSVVGVTSDLEAMILRAEISYNLYLEAAGRSDKTTAGKGAADWKKLTDQQGRYQDFDFINRPRDPDNYRLTGQYMTMIRYAGLADSDSRVPLPNDHDAEALLKDALKFREFIANRYPLDVDAAPGILESFEDLARFYVDRNRPDEISRLRNETIEAVKTKLLEKYEKKKDQNKGNDKNKASVPELSAQIVLLKLCRGSDHKVEAEAALRRGAECADVIRSEYPDAYRQWTEFRKAYAKAD